MVRGSSAEGGSPSDTSLNASRSRSLRSSASDSAAAAAADADADAGAAVSFAASAPSAVGSEAAPSGAPGAFFVTAELDEVLSPPPPFAATASGPPVPDDGTAGVTGAAAVGAIAVGASKPGGSRLGRPAVLGTEPAAANLESAVDPGASRVGVGPVRTAGCCAAAAAAAGAATDDDVEVKVPSAVGLLAGGAIAAEWCAST